ncbi:MAG: MBL fold metallo-hydrolase [Thermoleophilaceae bacterium]|nr:MBL fold metallo-hydrolase [Thermoleophilaceae bacterium]
MTDQNFTRVRRFGMLNVFLVEEEDGLTVIDTAMKSSKQIVQAAALKSLPIKRVVLTHAHDDHVGSLDALVAAVPDVEVIMSARDARLLAGDFSLDADEPQDKIRGGLKGQQTVPTRELVDGELVGSLRAIFTPGHTPGHFALIDERDGTLFGGDVYSTLAGLATSAVTNPLFPLVKMGTWHPPTVLESARRLAELDPARLAPGHGRVFEDPTSDMIKVIDKAAKRVGER